MMRRARHKSQEDAFYHICTRVAGAPDYYPLEDQNAAEKLLWMIQFFIEVYCCQLVAFEIMGNHYHFIIFMEKLGSLARNELVKRAKKLYGNRYKIHTAKWSDENWEKFNRKLFDVSSLLQQINGRYAVWFNRNFNRRGHFWSDRFKNPELLDLASVQECLLYIELNAVRAGLVKRPEEWKYGSAWLRWKKKDQKLMPLDQIFIGVDPEDAYALYRCRLYHRGAVKTKDGQAEISQSILEEEARSGFKRTGKYLDRLRFFTDGLAVGSRKKVDKLLDQLRPRNGYVQSRNPVSQLEGLFFTLRKQRSTGG